MATYDPADRYAVNARLRERYNLAVPNEDRYTSRYGDLYNKYLGKYGGTGGFGYSSVTPQVQQEEPELSWWQKPLAWANDTPVLGEIMRGVGQVTEWISYPWEEIYLPQVMSVFTDSDEPLWQRGLETLGFAATGGTNINPNTWDRTKQKQEEYENWQSPKYVKGALELANPTWYMGGGEAIAGLGAITKIPKVVSTTSKVGRGITALEAAPAKGLGKVLKKSWEVLPKTERTLYRRIPKLADDYIAKGSYTAEEKALIRDYFESSASKQLKGETVTGMGNSIAKDIDDVISKELNKIEPTRHLTGMHKVETLFSKGLSRASGFKKEMSLLRNKRTAAANAKYDELMGIIRDGSGKILQKAPTINPKTGLQFTHEEARAISNTLREGSLVDITKGFDLTPEEVAVLKVTNQEALDFKKHILGYNYKNKKGLESVSRMDMAEEAWRGFNRLVFENKPITIYQRRLLAQSLGNKFLRRAETAMKEGTLAKVLDIANLPRAVLASWDMSAPLRQGAILNARALTSGQFDSLGRSYKEMVKAFMTEKNAIYADDVLREMPLYEKWVGTGGYHSPLEHATWATGEEQFASRVASKYVPMVRRSERAYQTWLNYARYGQFEHTINHWEKMFTKSSEMLRAGEITKPIITRDMIDEATPYLNKVINAASGRGDLGAVLEGNLGALMNATLFSPRLLISRIQFPWYTLRTVPKGMSKEAYSLVRKEAAKELASFLGIGAGIIGLAAIAGAKIERDPRSSDFGKIRIGNTRHDIWAGYAQFTRLAAQLFSKEKKDALGNISEQNRWDTFLRFAQSKSSPGAGLFVDIMKGQSYMGDEIYFNMTMDDLSKQAYNRLVPLFIQDMNDAIKDQGITGGAITTPAFFGVGTQTYSNVSVDARETLASQFSLSDDIWSSTELDEAKQIVKPYYAISDNYWKQYPQLEAIYEQIKHLKKTNPREAERIMASDYGIMINQIRAEIARDKKMMLQQYPEIKEALSLVNS